MDGGRTRHYRDLLVWQKAMGLTKNIYRLTESLPRKETFGLQSQIRRASVSVPSNIAEGHGRLDDGHFRQFLAVSRGSLFELQTQVELCADLGYLSVNAFREVMEQCEEIARMLNGLLSSIAKDQGKRANDARKLTDSLTR
ncbi:MAG: four helix bundle protein [Terracidiphilus sp.]